MTVRTALIATVRLLRNIVAEQAPHQAPPPQGGAPDRFEPRQERRQLANADSGGGDPKGGTQIGW
ncbi:MAG TPA: hypothetical protein VIG99_14825 [Myxococcaceae bacterium]|jgi:hypothetical protein